MAEEIWDSWKSILGSTGFQYAEIFWNNFLVFGFFVVLAVPLSVNRIWLHMNNWYVTGTQKYSMTILWMVPI